jgi:hypothetical protein
LSTKRWLGNAASVKDLWTIALSGTVTSQTFSFVMNGKTIAYTTTTETIAQALAAFVTLWNQSSNPPEFAELTAVGLPVGGPFTSMTITQDVSGRPSAMTVATSGGATFTVTNTAPATGPNFFDNAQNWSGGVAPANSDVLVFDNGAVPLKYNLSTSLTGITLQVNPGYGGQIGLPLINADATTTYNEYRATSLTTVGGTVTINAPNLTRCNLAFGANTATVRILATSQQRPDQYTPIVLITGGDSSSELDMTFGDCGTAYYQGTTATFTAIKTGYATNALTDVNLICGPGSTLTTVTKNGGNLNSRASITTLTQRLSGGSVTLSDAAAVTTLNVQAGTCFLNTTGTVATVNLYGQAILNADADPRAKTITNSINAYSSGVTVIDNQQSINSGTLSIALNGNANCIVQHGSGSTLVMT